MKAWRQGIKYLFLSNVFSFTDLKGKATERDLSAAGSFPQMPSKVQLGPG